MSRKIVVNMEKVDLIDESGIGALTALRTKADKLAICCLQSKVRLVFEVNALDKVMHIYETENGALDYLRR